MPSAVAAIARSMYDEQAPRRLGARAHVHARDAADIAMSALSHGHRALRRDVGTAARTRARRATSTSFAWCRSGRQPPYVGGYASSASHFRVQEVHQLVPAPREELELYHGARCRVNVMSRDGTDFFHLHANASSPYTTEFYVSAHLPAAVDHLLAASYVTETNRLGVCIAEIASHAHGQTLSEASSRSSPTRGS